MLVTKSGGSFLVSSFAEDAHIHSSRNDSRTARSAKVAHLRSAFADLGAEFEVSVVDDLVTSDLTDAFKGLSLSFSLIGS